MNQSHFLLDAISRIVTIAPDNRSPGCRSIPPFAGSSFAARPAKHVEIHVEGENLMEDEIKPLYALISLPI